ncbi:molybdenum cofactor guanylyltransferase [Paludisphaera mucosa]|uniref:Probable molybdenum cofactor guanylyltransferase n=1 Tax=Paludisphaera mucosa TaxID=3030827 RepID=A0ABT6F694_9BACT|nr:molybdenum cofactor guanylyltransferase [Paludisphaera mucosa]MDG3002938.1 molybdenum cofactor guanylyltransferase [Paludisphaera mucosa]
MSEVAAIVLCGGESRRMGRPKADLLFGTETLLARVTRLLSAVARPVVLAAAPDQVLPPTPTSVLLVRDLERGRGPLQGFATGLTAVPPAIEFVYLAAVDSPFFEPAWMDLLLSRIGDHDAAMPLVAGRPNPVAALYRVTPTRVAVESLLAQDVRRLTALSTALRRREVPEVDLRAVDADLRTLANLNTPEDYRRALEGLDERSEEGPRRPVSGPNPRSPRSL